MAEQLDPGTQGRLLLRAVGLMLPILLLLWGALFAWAGQQGDLVIVGILLLGCGAGWLGCGLIRLIRGLHRPELHEHWPTGRL